MHVHIHSLSCRGPMFGSKSIELSRDIEGRGTSSKSSGSNKSSNLNSSEQSETEN